MTGLAIGAVVPLDEAEEAEVIPATVAELVDSITARADGPRRRGQADLHHDLPEVVGPRSRLRGHGGRPGAERRHADGSRRAPGAFAARLLPAPDESGVPDDPCRRQPPRRAIVQHPAGDERSGGQGDLPDDVLVSPSGGRRRVPAPHRAGDTSTLRGRGVRGALSVRRPRARGDRASGRRDVPVDAPLLVPHTGAAAGRPGGPRGRPRLLLGHDGRVLPSPQPGRLGHPHRRQPRSRPVVPPPLAGRRVELLRPPCARERRWPGHHPCDHARRGRHLAPEHGAGTADPGARRAAADHVAAVDRP